MMDQSTYANPFRTWANLGRKLRVSILAEIGIDRAAVNLTPDVSEFLGATGNIVNECENAAQSLDELERINPKAYEAVQRALGLQ